MGLRRALRLVDAPGLSAARTDALAPQAARLGIVSPWSGGSLSQILWNDVFGTETAQPVGRALALTIPAVVKGVELVTSTLADCPLQLLRGDQVLPAPRWAFGTDGDVAPQYRMAFTVEDLILSGWSLWHVERDPAGAIATADRVRPDRWSFNADLDVVIGDDVQPAASYVLIKGPHDGILTTGRATLPGALDLELAWQRAIRNPYPATVIQQTSDDVLTDAEIDSLLAGWRAARRDPDGAVAFVPNGLTVTLPPALAPDLLKEARNAVAVDIARLIGVPAVALDAGPIQTSLTYANTETANGSTLPLYGLAPYARSIGYALSMDNVCPSGTRMALDMTQLLADAATISRTGPATED